METVDITQFFYLDITAAIPDLFSLYSFALVGGMSIAIFLHLASSAVFGLIGLLDIKDK